MQDYPLKVIQVSKQLCVGLCVRCLVLNRINQGCVRGCYRSMHRCFFLILLRLYTNEFAV